jgi:CRP-like cAMP-binding protein
MAFESILTEKFGFTEADLEITRKLFVPESLEAKQHFVEEGKIATRLGIVVSGLFRTYYINRDADDITTAFHEPGTLLLSIDSFNNQVKSKENIMALVPSDILSITLDRWKELNEQVPKWGEVCRITGDYVSMRLQARAREFQTLSAKQRYEKFCEKHPQVLQQATLGQIASYLGIDIATLSRIRKKITF